MNFRPLLLIPFFLISCVNDVTESSGLLYPVTKKIDHIDEYHGQTISDPYRWLENDTSRETSEWVMDQNALTYSFLEKIPFREKIRSRLDELANYSRESAPSRVGAYYFFRRNNGLQNQDVIYIKKGLNGEESIFLDPNLFSEKGTVTFGIAGFSDDDQYVILSKSESGSDWRQLITYDISTKKPMGDTLNWVKFSGASWYNNGFYYSRYPAPEEGGDYSSQNSLHSVYYHKHGSKQEEDILVYQDKEHPGRYHSASLTEDRSYLIIYIAEGTDGYECHYKSLVDNDTSFTPLSRGFDRKNSIVDYLDGKFIVRTDVDAPNYRLVSVDPKNPDRDYWTEILPEGDHLLQSANSAGGFLFARYLENAQSTVYRLKPDGSSLSLLDLPKSGTIGGFGGKKEDTLLFYGYSSFTYPGKIYSYNIKTGESADYYQADLAFNSDDYISKQVWYESKDGSKVSLFVVHKKGLALNGNNPCLLYGYGGFNISLTPHFKVSRIPWLENGGVFAMPNLRGGGEYGENWHQAGMLFKKQNVFDDFIAAAEFLIKEKYTSSKKLVISGRSNGGLLVGAVMTQRPELMQVALPGVGVMDMLRYHEFTVGHGWIPEYGSSDESDHFSNLLSYSPLHNLKKNVDYPSCLIYTGDHDDRVVPAHSFKFAATLQEMNSGKNPSLIRIETDAGHGSGKPIGKLLDEECDKLSFSFYEIGHVPYSEN